MRSAVIATAASLALATGTQVGRGGLLFQPVPPRSVEGSLVHGTDQKPVLVLRTLPHSPRPPTSPFHTPHRRGPTLSTSLKMCVKACTHVLGGGPLVWVAGLKEGEEGGACHFYFTFAMRPPAPAGTGQKCEGFRPNCTKNKCARLTCGGVPPSHATQANALRLTSLRPTSLHPRTPHPLPTHYHPVMPPPHTGHPKRHLDQ